MKSAAILMMFVLLAMVVSCNAAEPAMKDTASNASQVTPAKAETAAEKAKTEVEQKAEAAKTEVVQKAEAAKTEVVQKAEAAKTGVEQKAEAAKPAQSTAGFEGILAVTGLLAIAFILHRRI